MVSRHPTNQTSNPVPNYWYPPTNQPLKNTWNNLPTNNLFEPSTSRALPLIHVPREPEYIVLDDPEADEISPIIQSKKSNLVEKRPFSISISQTSSKVKKNTKSELSTSANTSHTAQSKRKYSTSLLNASIKKRETVSEFREPYILIESLDPYRQQDNHEAIAKAEDRARNASIEEPEEFSQEESETEDVVRYYKFESPEPVVR